MPHGRPNRAWLDALPYRVGTPSLGDRARFHALVDEILDRRWLTNHGPVERELEARRVELVGTRHCIPVANATLGLLVTLAALTHPDGEVVMPAFTFPAAAHAATFIGRRPVFADVDPSSHTIDACDAAGRLTERTQAVV